MIRNATRNLIAACIHIYSQAINKLMYQAIFLQYKPQQLDVASFQLQVKKNEHKNKNKCHLHTKDIKDRDSEQTYEQTFMR